MAQPTETTETVDVYKPVLSIKVRPGSRILSGPAIASDETKILTETLKNFADEGDLQLLYNGRAIEPNKVDAEIDPTKLELESTDRGELLAAIAKIEKASPAVARELVVADTGRKKFAGTREQKTTKPPKITTKAVLATNFTWDSNAFQRKTNIVSDGYFTVVPQVSVAIPLRKTTQLLLLTSTTYARYNEQTTLDQDVATGLVSLAETLSSYQPDSASTTKRTETLTLKTSARLAYEPGFQGPGTRLYVPSLEWKTTGIPIGSQLCATKKKHEMQNCYVGTILAELGQSWSGSNGAAKNVSFKLGGSLGWNFRPGWSIEASAFVRDRYYEDYQGGRNDIFFSGTATLNWAPADNMSVSAGISYNDQNSSVNTLDFNQSVATPEVRGTLQF